jgi:hypothetical protein
MIERDDDSKKSHRARVPIPKFVAVCRTLSTNFGIIRDTSKVMILVWFMDLKFLRAPAAMMEELQIHHSRERRQVRCSSGDREGG